MKGVPVTLGAVAVVGALAGYWFKGEMASSKIEGLEQLVANLQAGVPPPTPVSAVPPVMLFPYLSVRVAAVLGFVFVLALVVAWRNGRTAKRLRSENDSQYELLQVAARNIGTANDDRDKAIVALKDYKNETAVRLLKRWEGSKLKDGREPRVTIRYWSYGKDHDTALQLKGVFDEYVRWPVTLDANAALPRAGNCKVVFDVGRSTSAYADLIKAFQDGGFIEGTVGFYEFVDREDAEHVIVNVLPSAD